MHIHFSRTWVP